MAARKRIRPSDERRFVDAPIPPAWQGDTVVCIACGPSLTQAQVNTVKRAYYSGLCHVLVVNRAFEIAPFADGFYAADPPFIDRYIGDVRDTHIPLLFTQDKVSAKKYGMWWTPGPPRDKTRNKQSYFGLCLKPNRIHYGKHSGFQCFNLAVHFVGVRGRIVLLGYDCRVSGKTHFHGDHEPQFRNCPSVNQWAPHYAEAAEQLISTDVEVINCTADTAIDAFPRKPIGAIFK